MTDVALADADRRLVQKLFEEEFWREPEGHDEWATAWRQGCIAGVAGARTAGAVVRTRNAEAGTGGGGDDHADTVDLLTDVHASWRDGDDGRKEDLLERLGELLDRLTGFCRELARLRVVGPDIRADADPLATDRRMVVEALREKIERTLTGGGTVIAISPTDAALILDVVNAERERTDAARKVQGVYAGRARLLLAQNERLVGQRDAAIAASGRLREAVEQRVEPSWEHQPSGAYICLHCYRADQSFVHQGHTKVWGHTPGCAYRQSEERIATAFVGAPHPA